jgi:UDP-N-acetylglucosamine diphosphorylase/glucosamine-1-phosphate N-acetyltransferase
MRICVFEDAGVAHLYPLTRTRPAFDLLCGASSLMERLQRFFAVNEVRLLVRPALAELCRVTHPGLAVNDLSGLRPGPLLLVNARWLPPEARRPAFTHSVMGLHGNSVAYVYLDTPEVPDDLPADLDACLPNWKRALPGQEAGGCMIDYPWDLIEANGPALAQDFVAWKAGRQCKYVPEGVMVLGPWESLLIDPAATVEPLVVADTRKGPVLIDRGAVVEAFSRLEGPCYVGPETRVLGARVRGCSFGPQCRIGGEVAASIFQGYANKSHDGFVGHSYVGEWVNLAAGTQTSDLRIDYAPINLVVGGRKVETGLLKVGSFIGDHTKTALNVVFNTGSLIGPFAQLLISASMAPRVVPAFCRYGHGRLQERTDLWEMFATAATVMRRRGGQWTESLADFFHGLFEATGAERQQVIREHEQRRLRQVV